MKIPAVFRSALFLCLIFVTSIHANPNKSKQTIKTLAVRAQFQPDDAETTTGDGTFDLSTSTDPFQIDPPPHNHSYFADHLVFLNNYYQKASHGALTIEGSVYPLGQNDSYQLDEKMTDYNPNTSADAINEGLARLFRDAIMKADEDPSLTFSGYDAFIVFHAGVGRDIDFGLDSTPQDIPSIFITQAFLQEHLGIDGVPVDNGAVLVTEGLILPETESQEGIQLGLNGMVVSNFGSQLGFLDLFSPETRRTGVGRFGLMDAGLFNGDGLLPSLPTAWTRIDAGWETPITIYQAQGDEFSVNWTLSDQQNRVYKVPINDKEYFLVENRYSGEINLDSLQFVVNNDRGELVSMREILETYFPNESTFSDSTGVLIDFDNTDRGLPGGGVLIWHIDENVIDANRAVNRINADPVHRGVDLEEADGSQDIGEEFLIVSGGSGSELGWAIDPWFVGNTSPLFENEFSVTSIPNSRSYTNQANSHIKIYDFSGIDSVATFKVDQNFFQPNFPQRINADVYGQVTSLKAADLDNSGHESLIMTTDRNKLLIMDENGRSNWGSDSLEAVSLPEGLNIMTPPAIFDLSTGAKAVAVLTGEGTAYGFSFNTAEKRLDSLFQFQCPAPITTHPIAEGSPGSLYWGCSNGTVYEVVFDQQNASLNELTSIPEAIKYLHFSTESNLVIVSASGNVYENGSQAGQIGDEYFGPAGSQALSVSSSGGFQNLTGSVIESPEDGVHQFDSPAIAIQIINEIFDVPQDFYLASGNNQLHAFNYNFTLTDDFPVKLYRPEQETDLSLSPLVGVFPHSGSQDGLGVIAIDPTGMLIGYDINGNVLPDFPLAVGETITVSPALLDIDGDGDLELACATAGGAVYAWDFSSPASGNNRPLWSQQFGTPQNNNRQVVPTSGGGSSAESLLPENSVYNWPNPNQDNFTFIRYRLSEEANVTVRIFDLAGDLVKVLEGSSFPQTDNEIRWDLTNVQTGVYLGRVEADSGSKKEVQVIKIAVVK